MSMLSLLVLSVVWPNNLTTAVAGLSVEQRVVTNVCWHDKNSGYFAIKTMECDGGHRMVILTKDRRVVGDSGYDTTRFGRKPKYGEMPITEKSFALSTKSGIKIGAKKADVLKKLGTPTKTAVRGSSGQFWCAMYKKVVMDSAEDGQVLRNTYIFKNGILIEISLNLDAVPGCGEDSLSDAGWPWTRF